MSSIADNIAHLKSTLPSDVTLVAVSKFHPVDALIQAYDCGVRDFGESRVHELIAKVPSMPADIRWHFIGHLQSNKVRALLPLVSLIHSVDSLELLRCINREAERIGKTVDVLLQLHVAQESTKFGFDVNDCVSLFGSVSFAELTSVRICGVMGMATNTDDEVQIHREFAEIRRIFDTMKQRFFAKADYFNVVSMGMTDDYPIAITEGSNMVRIGSYIFGPRQY